MQTCTEQNLHITFISSTEMCMIVNNAQRCKKKKENVNKMNLMQCEQIYI